ncbi:MBL fold metallo-hydrolase [Roseobacter sp. N2S]|uniref:MBL fold metallo-hydrolase n=1 Tax=Roseobacter sp. N2S TaxID=2663844 RepID=UPI00285BA9AA|nr:MBL fold metallo-hydrolase [Roseobacter sp. N2S]MDR6265546.1 phosphoribosyl 1,2-cyclic phosphate phosphodiesterase [Roseobacter sp. N2S]
MAEYLFTILGCGSSGGVPRVGGIWGDCDPNNPKNARQRCSMLVERITDTGKTSVLIDTSPDLRRQLLDANVSALDAVIYTHDHADHTHGIDDLRMVVFNMRKRLPIWADAATQTTLKQRFGYTFEQVPGTLYKPILEMNAMTGPVTIDGAGGRIKFEPFLVDHGPIQANGFRIGNLAYLPDVSAMNVAAWQAVSNLDCWIVDALRRDPHPTHSHLSQTLDWIERAAPKRAVLTNMHVDLDYDTLCHETPDHITPAFDGLQITLPA